MFDAATSLSMSELFGGLRVTITYPIDGSGNFVRTFYQPRRPRRHRRGAAFYQWPMFVTGLGYNISNLSGTKRLLTATAAFRNEPY